MIPVLFLDSTNRKSLKILFRIQGDKLKKSDLSESALFFGSVQLENKKDTNSEQRILDSDSETTKKMQIFLSQYNSTTVQPTFFSSEVHTANTDFPRIIRSHFMPSK